MQDYTVLIVAGVYLAVLGGTALAFQRRRRARAAGQPQPDADATELQLTFGDVTVRAARPDSESTLLWASCAGFPESLRLAPEGFSPKLGDLQTLDEAFDAVVDVRGDAVDVVARLDAEARRLLTGFLLEDDGRVASGAASCPFAGPPRGPAFERKAERAARVARAIGRGETPDRLADNVAEEARPATQARNLALLLAHFPEHPRARALAAPAEWFEDPWLALLKGSVRSDREAIDAAVQRLVATGGQLAPYDPMVAMAAAERLGRTGQAEPLLIAMLSDAALWGPAVRGLADTGTLDAVVALGAVERAHPAGSDLRRAAREAVARIQARAGGGAPGQLTLVGGAAGGELTLTRENPET